MSKKDYVIKLLDALVWKRTLARGLKILIEWNLLDDEWINWLIDILNKSIDQINDIDLKSQLTKSQDFLERLKGIELMNRKKEDNEIEELDQLLQNI